MTSFLVHKGMKLHMFLVEILLQKFEYMAQSVRYTTH